MLGAFVVEVSSVTVLVVSMVVFPLAVVAVSFIVFTVAFAFTVSGSLVIGRAFVDVVNVSSENGKYSNE